MSRRVAATAGETGFVLHVLEATLGGTRQYLDDLAAATRGLPLRMGLVHATERSDEGFAGALDRIRDAGWETWTLPMVRPVRPWQDLRAAATLRRLIRQLRPDVVHCHSSKAGGVGRMAVSLSSDRPWMIYSPHALAANSNRVYLAAEKILARWTDSWAAISDSERDEIEEFGLGRADRIDVVYPTIDTERFRPADTAEARREVGLGPEPLILGIGRFIHQKDPVGFVRVVERARAREPRLRAVWIGEGPMQGEVERAVAEAGLGDVIRIEPWKLDVRPWVAAADLLVSTARFESFGYVVAEGMAMGKPVVASRITGTVDVVQEEPAELLYPPADYDAAAALVVDLLADPGLRERYGRAGVTRIRRVFSREAMADRLIRAYSRAPGLADCLASRKSDATTPVGA